MANSEKMFWFKRHLFMLTCAIVIGTSLGSDLTAAALPTSCFVITYSSESEIDINCENELPDFSQIDFPLAPKVYELILRICDFKMVPKNVFQGLTRMRHLFVECANRTTTTELQFEDGSLQNLPELFLIAFRGSYIRYLPKGIFCHLPNLSQVFLRRCAISSAEILGFGDNCSSSYCSNNLLILSLLGNNITTLTNRTFCSLSNLIFLDVSESSLKTIEEDAFYNLGKLKMLDLSHNNLTSLPETVLKPLTGLYNLDLASNPNLNISGFLKHVPHLKGLFLPGIGLESLEKDSFQKMHQVESLMLYDNRLQTIHEDVFEPLIGLVDDVDNQTSLSKCEEDAIARLVFGGGLPLLNELQAAVLNVTGVRYLNLDGNNFTDIPPIRKMFKLMVFSIAKNRIEVLADDNFRNLRQLQRLRLSFNRIRIINHAMFANLKCLKQLLLDHNNISHINSSAFHDLTALTTLDLQHNRLKEIRGLLVKNDNLQFLNLSHNLLENLSLDVLPSNIVKLDLSHNLIKVLAYSSDTSPKQHMNFLDLSHNRLSAIDKAFLPSTLADLFLHNNSIESLSSCIFCGLGSIVNVTLHNNKLKTIRPEYLRINTLPAFQQHPNVELGGNEFVCNCQYQDLNNKNNQQYLFINNLTGLQCDREYAKNKPSRIYLVNAQIPEDVLCKIGHIHNATIPESCSVYLDVSGGYVIVDCSGGNLTQIPSRVFPGVRKLYLDGNKIAKLQNTTFQTHVHQNLTELYLNNSHIESIENNSFVKLVNLTRLHLQNNDLSHLTENTFDGLHNLIELRLSYNNLMIMEDKVFYPLARIRQLWLDNNHLRAFPVWELDNSRTLSSVSLSENTWSCDCDYALPFRKWLQESPSMVVDLDFLFCTLDGDSTSEVPLIAFNTSHCLRYKETNFLKSGHFPLLTGLVTILVLFTTACIALYIYRKEMQVLIYSRYGVRLFHRNDTQTLDGEKLFDAFICYSNSDEDFVVEELLPNLEGIEPPFRCCIHQRDFLIGGFITDNILEAVSKSRRSILVLSEAFIQSEWCRFEFKTAYVQMLEDKCNRVIVVVVGEIPTQLDPEMRLYLKTNTYITWGEKLFWERLYFAMPDRVQKEELAHDPRITQLKLS